MYESQTDLAIMMTALLVSFVVAVSTALVPNDNAWHGASGGLQPAEITVDAADQSTDESTSCGPQSRVAYVIASERRFNDGRVQQLRDIGIHAVRVDPFITEKPCHADSPGTEKNRGIFLAHRNAWAAIALMSKGQRSLVLESDFSVGNMTNEELSLRLDAVWSKKYEDISFVGWCDVCAGEDNSPCPSCATGYVMGQAVARSLVHADIGCSPVDSFLFGACWPCCGWISDVHEMLGGMKNCSWEQDAARYESGGHLFRGIFQQDVEDYTGTHNGVESDSPETRAFL